MPPVFPRRPVLALLGGIVPLDHIFYNTGNTYRFYFVLYFNKLSIKFDGYGEARGGCPLERHGILQDDSV
jgi:hypothetical protein